MKNPKGKTEVATINKGVVVDGGVTVKMRVGVVKGVVDDEGGLITTKKCYFVDLIIMVLSTFE